MQRSASSPFAKQTHQGMAAKDYWQIPKLLLM